MEQLHLNSTITIIIPISLIIVEFKKKKNIYIWVAKGAIEMCTFMFKVDIVMKIIMYDKKKKM